MTREDFDHEARVLLKPESGNGAFVNVSWHSVLHQFYSVTTCIVTSVMSTRTVLLGNIGVTDFAVMLCCL